MTSKARLLTFLVILALIPNLDIAKHKHPERWYQKIWCEVYGGETEVVLPDQTRCDCLTATHAIEFDFGPKWAEQLSFWHG